MPFHGSPGLIVRNTTTHRSLHLRRHIHEVYRTKRRDNTISICDGKPQDMITSLMFLCLINNLHRSLAGDDLFPFATHSLGWDALCMVTGVVLTRLLAGLYPVLISPPTHDRKEGQRRAYHSPSPYPTPVY